MNWPREEFQGRILAWFSKNHRVFPWRKTRNPFHILIAEICLQKTGAWKAEGAYNYILRHYESPERLANADIEDLKNVFKPLGMPERAELLIEICQDIVKRFSGKMPDSFRELISIKGVGPYVANAILNFAHDQPTPLIDEGIARVYRRVLALESSKRAFADKTLWVLAEEMLPAQEARDYNLGLLDLSALICKSRKPTCEVCPVNELCLFYQNTISDAK